MLAHVTGSTGGESCSHTWPSGFPSGGAAQFVGREKGFPNFLGRFSRGEENPLYPSDRGISVRAIFFSPFGSFSRACTWATYTSAIQLGNDEVKVIKEI